MESLLLLVLTSSSLVSEVLCAQWLNYACNPDTSDYSMVNPDPEEYHHVFVTDGNENECATSFSDDYKVFNITNCVKDGVLSIILSHEFQQSAVVGGRQSQTYYANCNTMQYSPQATIKFETEVTYLPKSSGFSDEFLESDPQVEVILRDLKGVEGYTVFTIGYPMWVELKGPAGAEMLPKECLAYSGQVSEDGSRKEVIRNGCSLDESLMLDFSENVTHWFDLGLEGFDPDLMFSEGEETGEEEEEEEEEEAEESQQLLQSHMYAFRFFDSRTLVVKCIVRLCPSGSGKCDISC